MMSRLMYLGTKHTIPVILALVFLSLPLPALHAATRFLATDGKLDLRGYNPKKNGIIELSGYWELLSGVLATPATFDSLRALYGSGFVKVPGNLSGVTVNGRVMPGNGTATYRLTVYFSTEVIARGRQSELWGIKPVEIHSAYNLWLNGKIAYQMGQPGNNRAEEVPAMRPALIPFIPMADTLQIVIQVSNFFDGKQFGSDETIHLGLERDLWARTSLLNFLYTISFAILLVTAMYHFFVFFWRREEVLNLHFGITMLLFAVQALMSGERVLFQQFPGFSMELAYKAWLATLVLYYPVSRLYHILFPAEVPAWLYRGAAVIFTPYLLLVLFTPYRVYSAVLNYVFIVMLAMTFIILIALLLAWRHKRPYSGIVFFSMLVPIAVGVNDLLYGLDVIVTGYYGPIGFLLYAVMQSAIISLRFIRSYLQVSSLSAQLRASNENLEGKVAARTAELNRLNAAKDKFISILSHDLRGPFHTMLSLSEGVREALQSNDLPAAGMFSRQLRDIAQNASRLLDNLLDWSRLQLGTRVHAPVLLQLPEMVEEILMLYRPLAEEKNISLTYSAEPGSAIFADKQMFATVVRNLLANAIKFTNSGGSVSIAVSLAAGNVLITVTDSGIGMDAELLRKLFQVGQQVSRRGTAGENGTGLGLLITKEFVEKEGGTLTVNSSPGSGSTFIISYPVAVSSR